MIKMRKNGFTLAELMMAMGVGAIIMAAVYGITVLAQKNSANMDSKVITQQDTRAVLELMAMEIGMASTNPSYYSTTWTNPSPRPCIAAAPVTYRGIKNASANSIEVAMDIGGPGGSTIPSGVIGDAPNEYIIYNYDGASTITRSVDCGPATAILGGAALFSNVRNNAAGIPLFQYFDKTNAPLAMPAGIPLIRRILITIVADTMYKDLNTNQPRRMVYSKSVIVRNHAINF